MNLVSDTTHYSYIARDFYTRFDPPCWLAFFLRCQKDFSLQSCKNFLGGSAPQTPGIVFHDLEIIIIKFCQKCEKYLVKNAKIFRGGGFARRTPHVFFSSFFLDKHFDPPPCWLAKFKNLARYNFMMLDKSFMSYLTQHFLYIFLKETQI